MSSIHDNDGDKSRGVKEAIARAFDDVSYPGDDEIAHCYPGDCNFEQLDLIKRFKGKHWKKVNLTTLHNSSTSFFTPHAFRFYLPAYMLLSIDEYKEADVIPDEIVCSLDPVFNQKSGRTEKFNETIKLLTTEQRSAIRLFLEYLRDRHGEDFPSSLFDLDRLIAFYAE